MATSNSLFNLEFAIINYIFLHVDDDKFFYCCKFNALNINNRLGLILAVLLI